MLGLVKEDRTAEMIRMLIKEKRKEKKTPPRPLWKRDWRK
jgi:hypothetical protein